MAKPYSHGMFNGGIANAYSSSPVGTTFHREAATPARGNIGVRVTPHHTVGDAPYPRADAAEGLISKHFKVNPLREHSSNSLAFLAGYGRIEQKLSDVGKDHGRGIGQPINSGGGSNEEPFSPRRK
jgi:hypothetical protein